MTKTSGKWISLGITISRQLILREILHALSYVGVNMGTPWNRRGQGGKRL